MTHDGGGCSDDLCDCPNEEEAGDINRLERRRELGVAPAGEGRHLRRGRAVGMV
eukprot:SAG11_NODE_662_length_7875_cov_17.557613_4_plen_54_part_00